MTSLFELRPAARLLTEDILRPAAASPAGFAQTGAAAKGTGGALTTEIFSTFKNVMGEVNRLQFNAEDQTRAFAAGDVQDVHDVALAINKAKFALDLTVRMRDKLLDAYRELSQMR